METGCVYGKDNARNSERQRKRSKYNRNRRMKTWPLRGKKKKKNGGN